jgi:conjugative relaxase-like TrwC/TraI family protein
VISIAMLSGGAARASYYLERDADCRPSRYYLNGVEPAGRWCGHGAAALGLDGPITGRQRDAFAGLLDGRLPDGSQVAQPVLRRNPSNPDSAKIDVRRCGLDLVVSAPKSVSVLHALADLATAAAVTAAHETAVQEALGYLERHAGHGTRGHQGNGRRGAQIETTGLVAAAFAHTTSRADDPQLHTHLVVANLLQGVDGKWSAVDSRAMHRHARTAGCIYQAVLRGELTKTLGVGWGPVRRGVAEIVGIPKELRKEFSTRRQAIEDELDRTGASGRKAAQRAAYVTRPAKTHTSPISLRASWAQRADAIGHTAPTVVADSIGRTSSPQWPSTASIAAEMFGPDGLTKHATSFDRRDVIQALTETLPAGAAVTLQQLEATATELLSHDDAVPLLAPTSTSHERQWSTRELLAAERWALAISTEQTNLPAVAPETVAAVTESRDLSAEQCAVVNGLLTSPALVDVVTGPAGSGKTASMRAAADAWRGSGVPVIGCALAAITARRLEAATGVPCASITRTLADLDRTDPATSRPAGLTPHSVVVVDEASMVGTRHYVRLACHVRAAGGKLVLVGDPAQLAEVDAGGMFAALVTVRGPLALSGNQRQGAGWERDALSALRDGDTDRALAAYVTHGRVHVPGAPSRTRRKLAADYVEHLDSYADPYAVVALAATRRDVDLLNRAIREQLRAGGRLGPDAVVVPGEDADRGYATGDLVIVTRNDHRIGLLNGTRATVTAANRDTLSLRTDTGEEVSVPTEWAAGHLDHGYAMTVHKAQGLTSQVALLYGATTLCQQAGYVALSRGREANHLYTAPVAMPADRNGFEITTEDATHAADVMRWLAGYLSRDLRQVLASHQQPIPAQVRTANSRRDSWGDPSEFGRDRIGGGGRSR